MTEQMLTGGIHHLTLTVTDLRRSREFYTSLLGFEVIVESPAKDDPAAAAMYAILLGGIVMARGSLVIGLRPVAPMAPSARTGSAWITSASACPATPTSNGRLPCSMSTPCRTARSPRWRHSAVTCSRSAARTTSRLS